MSRKLLHTWLYLWSVLDLYIAQSCDNQFKINVQVQLKQRVVRQYILHLCITMYGKIQYKENTTKNKELLFNEYN